MATAGSDAVDAYMAALEDSARAVAESVRRLVLDAAPGMTETVRYQMPCFLVDGEYLVYLGAWKRHLGLYPIPHFGGDLEMELGSYRSGNDTVRFLYRNAIPFDLVERLVAELIRRRTGRAESHG